MSNKIIITLPEWWALLGAIGADPMMHEPYREAAQRAARLYVDLAVETETIRVMLRALHPRLVDDAHPAPGICTTCWDEAIDQHERWPCPSLRVAGIEGDADDPLRPGPKLRRMRPEGYVPIVVQEGTSTG